MQLCAKRHFDPVIALIKLCVLQGHQSNSRQNNHQRKKRGNINIALEEELLCMVHPHGTMKICTLCHVMATSMIFSNASTLLANTDT